MSSHVSSKSTRGSHDLPPQDESTSPGAADTEHQQQLEYNGLISAAATSPPQKNCCTWKVASVFLVLVAVALIVTWQVLPAEDMVVKYLPKFDEPANPYTGPEAGSPSGGGGGTGNSDGEDGIAIGMPPSQTPAEQAGTVVPSFMQCPEDGSECCNGSPDNCKLRVDEMMFGLVHNSMSSEEGEFFIGYNHNLGLEKALVAGYRGLNLDVCSCGSGLQFCHNVCDLGERLPNEVFTNTLKFLNEYPSEVVVLLFQASTEKGPIVWNDLYGEMENVDGFTDMIYEHTYGDKWPTMGDLVNENKRVIVFYFNGGECADDECPPGFKYFYNYAAETQYESATLDDLRNVEYSCEITRKPEEDALGADFLVVNNFVTPPDPDASAVANGKTFLSERLTNCGNENNMRPNFVYLDFWSKGVTAQLVQYANQQYAQQLSE